MTRAIALAYHNVGVRCLSVLLEQGIDVPLVVTHSDDPAETIWFASVRDLARSHGIPVITPDEPNAAGVIAQARASQPDFVFSFYYRYMLGRDWLGLPLRGALNMHGSLLPHYRGRAPVNWAVINGEAQTGATLHYMTEKPDAGDIVDQQPVPILPDDTAFDVFAKVTIAAATVLDRSLPLLVSGAARRRPQDLAMGSYFGGRKPADGRIDWSHPAARIHDLVRGVAPPYPGAYTRLSGKTLRILATRVVPRPPRSGRSPSLFTHAGGCYAACANDTTLEILAMELEGAPLTADDFAGSFGSGPVLLETAAQ